MLQAATLNGIRVREQKQQESFLIYLENAYKYFRLEEPYRAVFDLEGTTASTKLVFRSQNRHLNF